MIPKSFTILRQQPSTDGSDQSPTPIFIPPASRTAHRPLPYKYVIFKNSVNAGDWDSADVFPFEQKHAPTTAMENSELGTKCQATPIVVLTEFCSTALGAIRRYLDSVNQDLGETPDGCCWCVRSVFIHRSEDGVLSCREFGLVTELMTKEVEQEESDAEEVDLV